MAKRKADPERHERFLKFFAANYFLELLEDLVGEQLEYMDHGAAAYGIRDWRSEGAGWLKRQHGIQDDEHLGKIFSALEEHLDFQAAQAFILRGFDLPNAGDLFLLREHFITGQL